MEPLKNSVLLRSVITAIYNVASRRTSSKSADESIGSTIKTLEKKYDFLRHVNIDQKDLSTGDFAISFSEDIDELHPAIVGRALEALIRVVYNDIGSEAGLYFVTELKQLAGDDVSRAFTDREIDLDQVQLEQHYAYNRQERKRAIAD
ncbi:MAG: hypothetical protein KAH91_06450, partial [Thermoplasmatales archaeon]|nr:hypothetical protein [Thermoplasmatales archaeon]